LWRSCLIIETIRNGSNDYVGIYKMTQRTDEALWDRIKRQVTAEAVAGTQAGQWSARKAQLAVKRYKAAGGGYVGKRAKDNPLVKWTQQDWRTKSGLPSSQTGERYLPANAIKALTPAEYAETSTRKRMGMLMGEQYVPQPPAIAKKTKRFRK
jgi:hypothetical protein